MTQEHADRLMDHDHGPANSLDFDRGRDPKRDASEKAPGKDILLVEDHPSVAAATKSFLEVVMRVEGKVVVAGCAEETIELLRADPCRWRLILLDLRIPGAVGLSVAMQIKDLGLASITCLLTGEDRPDYVATVRDQGFLGYIRKGQKITDLAAAMTTVLVGRPSFPIVDDQRPC
jgi:DNA-binding NarL/FixJ family response regulator